MLNQHYANQLLSEKIEFVKGHLERYDRIYDPIYSRTLNALDIKWFCRIMYLQDFELLKHAAHDLRRILTFTLDITNRLFKLHVVSQSEYYGIISLIGFKLKLKNSYATCMRTLSIGKMLGCNLVVPQSYFLPIFIIGLMPYASKDNGFPSAFDFYDCLWGNISKPRPDKLRIPSQNFNSSDSAREDSPICEDTSSPFRLQDYSLETLHEKLCRDEQPQYLGAFNRIRSSVSMCAKIPSLSTYAHGYAR